MPIGRCTEGGKPGVKWGATGKCYTYTPGNEASRKAAIKKAQAQGYAAGARGSELAVNLAEEIESVTIEVEL
jgi:hypothetical protein